MEFSSISDAVNNISVLSSIYTGVRIVAPQDKEVLYTVQHMSAVENNQCYQFWAKGEVCQNCISMWAVKERQLVFKVASKGDKIFAVTAIPVIIAGKNLVIELIQDVTDNLYFDDNEPCDRPQILIRSISDYINTHLLKDDLTGLYNRRFITEMLPKALASARTSDMSLSIIYADIDHFKIINDSYGHVVGDQVLQGIAKVFRKNLRQKESWVARYGGEEFLICLPGANGKLAKNIAERLRIAIMRELFKVEEKIIHVTCSFGVQTLLNEKNEITAIELISIADKKMYKAKQSGRNRVV